jgi:hypothetical protein
MTKPTGDVSLNLMYVDHPEVSERFVDSMERIFCDGANVRMVFVVTRLDEPKPPLPPSGKKHTACRLIMPLSALPQFVDRLNSLLEVMSKQGAFHQVASADGEKPN